MGIGAKNVLSVLILMVAMLASMCAGVQAAEFISAPSRVDMVYDDARSVLYITSGSSVLRYNLTTKAFLTPYTFGSANLSGIDLSPDGNTLAIADRNMTGIHLVDLQTDTIKPDITFTPASGEGGSFTVAYGNDGALLVSTRYNGSGWVPLRRVDPLTREITIISKGTSNLTQVRQDTMLSSSADGKCIGYAESNSSDGPIGIYDVTSQKITNFLQLTSGTDAFNFEIGTNRNCTQFAVPTYYGTYIYNSNLLKLGTVGAYAGGQPIGVVYHPTADIVYFAWADSNQVRAYDTTSFAQLASFDVGYTFQHTGNYAFNQGRMKVSRDGSLLFVTVGNGISYVHTALNPASVSQSVFVNSAATKAITLTASSPRQLPLTYTIVAQPGHGTLQGTPPYITYTPESTYTGVDSFTFKASDGTLESTPATVSITIDTSLPTVSSFSMPVLSSTLTVPVTTFIANDDVGVAGYCLSESSDPTSCSWSVTPPISYRFGGIGPHTLYAFARDGAGNVSDPASASVDIPQIVPVVTAFSIPATYGYDNLTIPVTLTASDDIGVTGYCLTETADPATCSWQSWKPTSYTFTLPGPHTLYAFAKNFLGAVSASASASTTVVGQVNFIPAPGRVDMVYDSVRDVVYITAGTSVLRYKIGTNSFLAPYVFGLGNLSGIDLSPDGNTLAIADRNITGIHLVDLQTDTAKPDITFNPYISGEGGTYSVAYGGDGALLVTSQYNGSGWAPLRRIVPDTGLVTIIKTIISQDAMLSASANGKCIGYVEGNISSGPLSIYDVASRQVTTTVDTDWFTYEIGTNRDCTQFAVPTYDGTFVYDGALAKLGTIGVYAGGQPIGVAYHPTLDVVYFAWVGTKEVRSYNTATLTQTGAFDVGYTFQNAGNHAFSQGRLKVARDGSLLFATVGDGVYYQHLSTEAPVADNQMVTAYAGSPLPITLTGSSPTKASLAYSVITPPAHGTLSGTAPNLVYTANAAYAGVDSITFKVSDGSSDSNVATMTITVKPITTGVSIAPPTVKGQLTLSWTNPVGADFSHSHIYRSTTAGVLGTLIADNLVITTYTDTGLASLTTYYYTVRSVDTAGTESNNTAQVSQATLDATAPLTVATPQAGSYITAQNVTLSCSDGTGGGCAATYYCFGTGCTPATAYTGTISVPGSTDLRYYSVDRAGNVEAVKTVSYIIQPHYITLSPAPVSMGAALQYYPVSRTVTIGNAGSQLLVIGSPLAVTGPDSAQFSVTPGGNAPCPSLSPSLTAGESCTITVTFTPDSAGSKLAYLHIASNADNNPAIDLPLSGTGLPVFFLTTNMSGSGAINNLAQPPVFTCDAAICTAPFAAGTTLVLRATPAANFDFSGWSGEGCSGTEDCAITLVSDATITASFEPLKLVKIGDNGTTYNTLAAALATTSGDVTFRARNVTFNEDITLDRPLDVTILGGFMDGFSDVNGFTELQGALTISLGSLTVDGLVIQ